jgi:hypothetical protein
MEVTAGDYEMEESKYIDFCFLIFGASLGFAALKADGWLIGWSGVEGQSLGFDGCRSAVRRVFCQKGPGES